MSQQQPQRPQPGQVPQYQAEPIKYSDVFPTVHGDLANQPIKPQDAAMMQSAENMVMGQTQKGGPAAVMQSASTQNERAGFVVHDDVNDVPADQGVTVTETDLPGRRVITESVAGQVVSQYTMPAPIAAAAAAGGVTSTGVTAPASKITIGEALEAAAMTGGDKAVEQSDAAAIQAAEIRATGINETVPGGIAAEAQSAANSNLRTVRMEAKTTLEDVLSDATAKLPADKAVTARDAERVTAAELRNNLATAPGGVAASMAAAAATLCACFRNLEARFVFWNSKASMFHTLIPPFFQPPDFHLLHKVRKSEGQGGLRNNAVVSVDGERLHP